MGAESTLLYGYEPGTKLRNGPLIQTIRGEKDWGESFHAAGSGHALDPDTMWPSPMTGSVNIRWTRATILLWRAYHYGTQADLDAGWKMIEGALDNCPHNSTEPWAGGAYGQWNSGCLRAVHALAVLVGHPLAARLRDYDRQNLAGYALVAQSQPPTEATGWQTPFGEPRSPKCGGRWSTTATHTRSYISPASRNNPQPADIYFNLVPYGEMLLALTTGNVAQVPEFVREIILALNSVRSGLGSPFSGTDTEDAIVACVEDGELGPILSWFVYPMAARFRFARFVDGAVLSYAEQSVNAGSTFFNGACYQDKNGGRKWTGACAHPSYRSFGKRIDTSRDGTTVKSWLPGGVTDPRMIPEFSIEITGAPLSYDVLVRRDGTAVDLVSGTAPPPEIEPPSDVIDMVEMLAPDSMDGFHLSREGGGYGSVYHDVIGQLIWVIKNESGWPADIFGYDDDYIYLVATEHEEVEWGDPKSFKLHTAPIRLCPRYVPADEAFDIRTAIPRTDLDLYADCAVVRSANLGTASGRVIGPMKAWKLGVSGNDIPGSALAVVLEWAWADEANIETYYIVQGFGIVDWKRVDSGVVVADPGPKNILVEGKGPLPRWECLAIDLVRHFANLLEQPPLPPGGGGNSGGSGSGCSILVALGALLGALAMHACL